MLGFTAAEIIISFEFDLIISLALLTKLVIEFLLNSEKTTSLFALTLSM